MEWSTFCLWLTATLWCCLPEIPQITYRLKVRPKVLTGFKVKLFLAIFHRWCCVLRTASHHKVCNIWPYSFVEANLELICLFQSERKHFHASKIKTIKQIVFREGLFSSPLLHLVPSFPLNITSLRFFPMVSSCKCKKIHTYLPYTKGSIPYTIYHIQYILIDVLHLAFFTL